MEYQRFGNQYVLKLDPGEEVMSALVNFASSENIRGGYFMAFGAFSKVKLRYFDVQSDQYKDHELDQQVEVVSLMGNIALVDGHPMIHMHTAVADGQNRTYSGHIGMGIVRPTLELFLTRLDGEIHRTKDPETGLELLDLPHSTEGRQGKEQQKKAA